jgi:putative RecB family exonuclease
MTGQPVLAILRQEAHISVSSITCYLRCAEQYFHRYIARTPPSHRPTALAFGSAVHHALAVFYRELMHGHSEPSPEELVAAFSDAWTRELVSDIPVLFDKAATKDSLRDKGVEIIRLFHAEAPRPHRVIGVEEPFSVEICDPTSGEVFDERLVGAIDAVVEDCNGTPRLLEHKTGARKRSFAHDIQGTVYATVVAPLIGLARADVTFQLLVKTKTPALVVETFSFSDADKQDFFRLVTGVLTAVRSGAFFPRRDWQCRGCPYAGPCIAG